MTSRKRAISSLTPATASATTRRPLRTQMKRTRIEKGIYQQDNGTYGVYLHVNGKPRFKTVGRKLSEARRLHSLLTAKAERGELPVATRLSFAELAATWIENFASLVAAGERSPRTLENYTYYLNHHLLPAFGHKRLPEISTDDIAELIAKMRNRGLSAKTINNALIPLGRILSHALRRGYITDHPLRRLEQHERPRIQKRQQRVLNHQQITALLDASLPRYQPMLATAIYTGLRLNELLGLTWADADSHRRLHPRPTPTLPTHPRTTRPPRPPENRRRHPRHSAAPPTRRTAQTPQTRLTPLNRQRLRLRDRHRHTTRL